MFLAVTDGIRRDLRFGGLPVATVAEFGCSFYNNSPVSCYRFTPDGLVVVDRQVDITAGPSA